MTERRSLVDGVEPMTPKPAAERDFVYAKRPEVPRVLLSSRIRGDLAQALKRASLQRQLEGITPYTLQDILEEAIQPWLKKNGFL